MTLTDFVTLDFVASFVGPVVVTMLLTQFSKELPYIKNIPTKYFVFVLAFVNILFCQIASGKFVFTNLYLVFINAVLVTFTATGGYDFTMKSITVIEEQKKIGF